MSVYGNRVGCCDASSDSDPAGGSSGTGGGGVGGGVGGGGKGGWRTSVRQMFGGRRPDMGGCPQACETSQLSCETTSAIPSKPNGADQPSGHNVAVAGPSDHAPPRLALGAGLGGAQLSLRGKLGA